MDSLPLMTDPRSRRTAVLAFVVALLCLAPQAADATTYAVTTTTDEAGTCDSSCSFREALAASNTNAGTDAVVFDLAGPAPHTLTFTSALPIITGSVLIDGTWGSG